MLNKNDKKNIGVVILVLIIIMGILIATRGCDQQEEVSDNPSNQESTIVVPIEEEKEENQGQSEEFSNENPVSYTTNTSVNEEKEEVLYPMITIEQTDYTVMLGDVFVLPEISSLEDDEDSLEVNITYSFKSFDSSEFYPVLEFSTDKIGTYKITYHVENKSHYVSRLEIYVEIVDNTSPIVEGVITKYNLEEGITEYIPVASGGFINQSINISFWDNDEISYAEYYNAKKDNTITGDTLEQEALPTLIPVDINSTLTLTEEGEYHIRVYDRSGNTEEYVVTIDLTLPTVEVEYEQINDDLILVTITSLEELKQIEGWELSEDYKVMTKIYEQNILEDVRIADLSDNQVMLHLEYEKMEIKVIQNGIVTESRNLNQNDGIISLNITGNKELQITYTLDGSDMVSYTSGDILNQDGYYEFQITDGNYIKTLEFSISSMGTND